MAVASLVLHATLTAEAAAADSRTEKLIDWLGLVEVMPPPSEPARLARIADMRDSFTVVQSSFRMPPVSPLLGFRLQ